MTSNQIRAATLAENILRGATQAASLPDGDWHLLLLAGGINQCGAPPMAVARRVLDQAGSRAGYFAPRREEPAAAVRARVVAVEGARTRARRIGPRRAAVSSV